MIVSPHVFFVPSSTFMWYTCLAGQIFFRSRVISALVVGFRCESVKACISRSDVVEAVGNRDLISGINMCL